MKKSDIDAYVSERTRGRGVSARYILVRLAGRISAQLDALRRDQGLSQQNLADLAGTSKAQVNRLLSGDYTGTTTTSLCRVAAALGCDVDVRIRPVPDAPQGRWAVRTGARAKHPRPSEVGA